MNVVCKYLFEFLLSILWGIYICPKVELRGPVVVLCLICGVSSFKAPCVVPRYSQNCSRVSRPSEIGITWRDLTTQDALATPQTNLTSQMGPRYLHYF